MRHHNWYNEEYMEARRKDVVDIASGLISGTYPFLEGIRALNYLGHQVSEQDFDNDFILFLAIDSETDHLPSADIRHRFSKEWSEKADKEISEKEAFYNDRLVAACDKLIIRFGLHA